MAEELEQGESREKSPQNVENKSSETGPQVYWIFVALSAVVLLRRWILHCTQYHYHGKSSLIILFEQLQTSQL
jgi:hypothetical protein